MSKFGDSLVRRLMESGVKVTENCIYWKPVLISYKSNKHSKDPESPEKVFGGELVKLESSNIDNFLVGRAVNQYFIQKRIAETSTATLWRCYDVISNEFYCIKLYHIASCKKERSVRFFRDDTEVVTLLDKVIDEIIYHSSLQSCSGVCKVREVVVDLSGDLMYFIMNYYPSQLMNYDFGNGRYCAPYLGDLSVMYLYNEETARQIMRQLVTTTQYLHSNGIVHKDIKPDNILISTVDAQMFDAFESPEETCVNADATEHFMDTTPYNDDCDELLEKIELLRPSEILKFSMEGVARSLPREIVAAGFPYNYSDQFDFIFTMWEDSKLIIDLNCFRSTPNEFYIGKNALLFARQASLGSDVNAKEVYLYFTKNGSPLNYKVNRNFQLAATSDAIDSADGASATPKATSSTGASTASKASRQSKNTGAKGSDSANATTSSGKGSTNDGSNISNDPGVRDSGIRSKSGNSKSNGGSNHSNSTIGGRSGKSNTSRGSSAGVSAKTTSNNIGNGIGTGCKRGPKGRGRSGGTNNTKICSKSDGLPDVQAVLSDFGVTSIAEEESGELVIFDSEGTISFTSPESLKYIDGSISAAGREVFSLGVTLYCMIYGTLPYSGKNSIEMLINILETPLVFHKFRKVSNSLQQLLTEMLNKDHEKRIKLDSILNHPWFNENPI